jgi:DNA polymerase-3 subunit alpha
MAFAHLHTHTEYSLLDGSNKIKEYVARVKELGMNSAAITDHGNMYGVVEFYKTAKAADINPIIGCEIYVAPNSRFDRETGHGEDRYYHLSSTLTAKRSGNPCTRSLSRTLARRGSRQRMLPLPNGE